MGNHHEYKHYRQENTHQRNGKVIGDKTEQRRHQGGANVGAGGLDAHQCLRAGRAEVNRGGMHDAGINRGAAQANQQKSCHSSGNAQRKQHGNDTKGDDSHAQADHLGVIQLYRHKAADGPANGDAQEKQTGEGCGRFFRQTCVEGQIGAAPQRRGLFQGAVAEEGDHDGPCPGYLQCLRQSQGRDRCILFSGGFFP